MRPLEARLSAGALCIEDGERTPFVDAASLVAVVAGLKAGKARRLRVIVEPPLLQRRTLVDLPPVRRPQLEALIQHAPGRYFRQNGHPLVSAATWTMEGTPPRRVARAVALEADVAAAVVEGSIQGGWRLEDIVAAGHPDLSLLPPAERTRRAGLSRRRELRLGGAVLLLWLAALPAVGWSLHRREAAVDAELGRLEEARRALQTARQALDSAAAMITGIDGAAAARNQLILGLADLLGGLGDSTVVTAVTLDAMGSGEVSGRAPDARSVVARVSQVPGLATPRLVAGGSRDSTAGRVLQQFTIHLGVGN